MKRSIYADNAATTKLDIEALEAMLPWLNEEYGNASQPYAFSRKPKKAIAEAREIIASCINARPEEIFFTSGGTESDNWAIKGSAFCDAEKRETITSQIEHHALLNACRSIEGLGYPVSYLPVDRYGVIAPSTLDGLITRRTRLVSVMLANNEIGTIEPIMDLAEISHKNGAVFHTDAVQAVGHIPVDVKKLGVDMLSASAHKFNGPKGVGFLFIKNGTLLVSLLDGGTQEFGMRAGTENVASIVGMAVALKNNCDHMESHREHILSLERSLINGIDDIGIDYIHNGSENHLPGIINLSFKGADGETLLHRLDLLGTCVSTSAACDSKNTRISHVLKAIELDREYALGTIRLSLGKDNLKEDVHTIVDSIRKILL